MRRVRWAYLAGVLMFCWWLIGPVAAQSNVNVSIGVGDTILQVSGQTSPSAFVTISRDGGVIGTTTADSAGLYSQTFLAQTPGLHTVAVFAQTPGGVSTDTITNNINITEHATTTVQVFLPPTIVIDNPSPGLNQPLVLHGEAPPNSTIVIYVDNTAYVTASVGNDGIWQVPIDTSQFATGNHSLFARAVDSLSQLSSPSSAHQFSVAAPQVPTPTTEPAKPATPRQTPHVPVIIFPKNGDVWRQSSMTIRGLGDPDTQIELWDGDHNIGSVWVGDDGQWSLDLTLLAKEYSLRVRSCREGVCSIFSDARTFTYQPHKTPDTPEPLYIALRQSAAIITQNQPLNLQAEITNGQQPYSSTADWGDTTTSDATHPDRHLSLAHRYTKPGKYTIRLTIHDNQNRQGQATATVEVLPPKHLLWQKLALALTATLLAILALPRLKKHYLSKLNR